MKSISIMLMSALLLFFLVASQSATAQGMPHAIIGVAIDESGAPAGGATVVLTNGRTGESLTVTANSLGQYQIDLTTMPSGYQVGDVINVKATLGDLVGKGTVTVSGGPLDQCDIVLKERTAPNLLIIGGLVAMLLAIVILAGIFLRNKESGKAPKGKGRRRK